MASPATTFKLTLLTAGGITKTFRLKSKSDGSADYTFDWDRASQRNVLILNPLPLEQREPPAAMATKIILAENDTIIIEPIGASGTE